jgi:hypothetical protein
MNMTISLPVTLHIAIGDGDVVQYNFETLKELIDFISRLADFECVWLMTTNSPNYEIVVTESISFMCHLLAVKSFHGGDNVLHIHEYPTYEDAYKVALDMRADKPNAFN